MISYVALLLGVSIYFNRSQSSDETAYAMAGRKVPWYGVFASVFTLIGAGEFLTVASLAFVNDGAAISLLAGYGVGMVILGIIAKRGRQGDDRYYLSIPDMVYDRFGSLAGLLANGLTILAFFALLVLQVFAGALVISEITPIPVWGAAVATMVIVTLYLYFSGFGGVIATDIFQCILMVIGLPALALIALPHTSDIAKVLELEFGWLATISVLLTGIFVVVGSGDIWQRVYAAKSSSSAKLGLVTAGLGFAAYSVILALVGIAARESGLATDGDSAFLSVVLAQGGSWLAYLVILAVFSAILSTADTEAYLISSLVANEQRRWSSGVQSCVSSEVGRRSIRVVLPIVAVLATGAALMADSLVAIYELLLLLLLALSPLVILSVFRNLNPKSGALILIVGIVSLVFVHYAPFVTLDWVSLVIIPGLIVGYFMSEPKS